ncbi:MAG: hypothetical protein II850_08890 [Fibrobacter sp.]|nr:hypothetical protein [Fibrobacter sp.]
MMYRLLTLLAVVSLLSGCSSIMRPPPAAAFMDTYKSEKSLNMVGASGYGGDMQNRKEDIDSYHQISEEEWWVDGHFARFLNGGYFTLGLGMQSLTAFMQGGFVSPYFGFNAWSNMNALFIPMIKDEDRGFWSHYSGGAMTIEQIPVTQKWALGLTQHISRNGREIYKVTTDNDGGAPAFDKPRPKFYKEMGAGLYGRYKGEKAAFSLEFRYGRDIDNDNNRFALTLSVWGFSKPFFSPHGYMRTQAEAYNEKSEGIKIGSVSDTVVYNVKTMDSVYKSPSRLMHKIPNRWFSVLDTSKVISKVYPLSPIEHSIYSNGICYDEYEREVWLRKDTDNTIFATPIDNIDYCEEAVLKFPWSTVIFEGLLFGGASGLLLHSFDAFLIGDLVGSTAFWAIFKAADVKVPKNLKGICKLQHSPEELEEWLKQYPCYDSNDNEF